jgi:carboxyl-terminal processing protease
MDSHVLSRVSYKLLRWTVVAALLVSDCAVSNAQTNTSTQLSAKDRFWIASKIYASVQLYFAHWQAVPDLDFDAVYKDYVDRVAELNDRRAFDLATLRFMATLKNGHTRFYDKWLDDNYGQPLGFLLAKINDKWVVTSSQVRALSAGDVVEGIDDLSLDQFFEEKRNFISESSERAQRVSLFYYSYLFPESFVLHLEGGGTVQIDRKHQQLPPGQTTKFEARMLTPDVAFIRIPTFELPDNETRAVEFLKEHGKVSTAIIDVRGNPGGNTPSILIRAVMDRPYRDWTEASSLNIGLFAAYDRDQEVIPLDQLGERAKGWFDAFKTYFHRPQFMTPGSLVKPEAPIFNGKLLVLTDFDCGSACEDFVMPLKFGHRATIMGEGTGGTSGQPFLFDFGNGMGFRVGAKRLFFPDGSQFEGVGIAPDVAIQQSIEDIRKGTDVVLNRAMRSVGVPTNAASARRP